MCQHWIIDPGEQSQIPAFLVGFLDEEQKQWTALLGLQAGLRVRVHGYPDQLHVRSDGVWRGLARSGWMQWPLMAVGMLKMAYGCFAKSKNSTELSWAKHERAHRGRTGARANSVLTPAWHSARAEWPASMRFRVF